ncbi:FAD-binding protein, partial [Thermocatellispora tengchongensis]
MTDTLGLRPLADAVSCNVIFPGDPGYQTARRIWNADIDRHPSAIVQCRTAQDAAAALSWCAERRVPITVRGGGHNL